MNQEQLKKMESYFDSEFNRANNEQSRGHVAFEEEGEVVQYRTGSIEKRSRLDGFDHLLSTFKDLDHKRKCSKVTKTKWDNFAPYAFSKLEKTNKIETFLQLFDDYKTLKLKYNEEIQKNKKMMTKLHHLQNQFSKVKAFNSLAPSQKLRAEKEKDEEVVQMKGEIKRLHEKIIALTGGKHKLNSRPKSSYQKPQKHIVPVNQNLKAELDNERKQVRELLLIIDELKKNKFEVENLLKDKQANESVYRPRKTGNKPQVRKTQSQFYEYANDIQKWKEKYNDLELCYNQMNEDKDRKIKELATQLVQVKQSERMKQRMDRRQGHFDISLTGQLQTKNKQLREENDRLEQELKKLVQLPFYQNNKQIIQVQEKLTKMELKCTQLKEQYSKANDLSMKYFSQLEFKTKENQMFKSENTKLKKQLKESFERQQGKKITGTLNIDYDDYYRKLLALVKFEGDDPTWKKFANMAQPQFHSMTSDQILANAKSLWNSKLQLLAHLEKAQIQLATLKESVDARINLYARDKQVAQEELKVTRARLQELMSIERVHSRRDYKVYEQTGIKYDDSVSVFDAEELQLRQLQSNENYFDLYLGQMNINEVTLMKNPQNKIKNISNFVSFLTLDFYNHETQHSEFVEGVTRVLNNNYSFKVEINAYFLKYLSKNTINVQFWSPQGSSTVLLGKGQIRLSDIISKATKDISNVIRGKCSLYSAYISQRSPIASVQFRMRMRLPVGPFIEWAQTKDNFKSQMQKDPFSIAHKKNLNIVIERAQGLLKNINAFVYFSVQNEDFFTEPEHGPSPYWDFHRQILVTVDDEFTDTLKQHYFEFIVFDDEKDVNEDIYGVAKANLTPLVEQTDELDLVLDICNSTNEKVGKLKVKVGWI